MKITVAIPTYGRDQSLVDTIEAILGLSPQPLEVLVVDQTRSHSPSCFEYLKETNSKGLINWMRLSKPSITQAMNIALKKATGDHVLFLDDDIIPDTALISAHLSSAIEKPNDIIAGRVLQPWHQGKPDPAAQPFLFNSLDSKKVKEFIGCNVCIPRDLAIDIGGFDVNFVRVAYRYEAEFAHRWIQSGLEITYSPKALIHHLKVRRGGTRSHGDHLRTWRPDHSVGRYYYLLKCKPIHLALVGFISGFFRSIRTRHHLSKPWWIPFTAFAELTGACWAINLALKGAKLLKRRNTRLLIVGSHPIQYQTPLFKDLEKNPELDIEVLYLSMPTSETQGLGFDHKFSWDIPLLDGYPWRKASTAKGSGISSGYTGVWVQKPLQEIFFVSNPIRPDAILLTGWHFIGLVQIHIAACIRGIPIILRMESNSMRPRSLILKLLYWVLFRGVRYGLPIGKANNELYTMNHVNKEQLIYAPYFVDNSYFMERVESCHSSRVEFLTQWNIPSQAFCFLFVGKLQAKKNPIHFLEAFEIICKETSENAVHALVVGSGHLSNECQDFATKRHLPVTFTGFINQSKIASAYSISNCIILPSDHGETWGLVVNEAMACGLPAIVSNLVGCANDLVINGQTGLVFNYGDIQALADCMQYMYTHQSECKQMGKAARNKVNQEYSISATEAGIVEAVSNLYI